MNLVPNYFQKLNDTPVIIQRLDNKHSKSMLQILRTKFILSWNEYMFNHIDYKNGTVTFIDDGDYLKEDLLQVEYPNGFILDVGWYNSKIGFIVYIIKNHNWENPIAKYSTKSKKKAVNLVLKAIIEVEKFCNGL